MKSALLVTGAVAVVIVAPMGLWAAGVTLA